MGISDLQWMQLAYYQSLEAQVLGEIPVGAVLVDENNILLASAHNRVILDNDPCAHAEILALRQAGVRLGNYRLNNTTLYVTLEPCSMCAGALVHARVKRVVFATRDFKAGAAGSVYNLLQGYPLNHQVLIDEGLMQKQCAQLISEFFNSKRE